VPSNFSFCAVKPGSRAVEHDQIRVSLPGWWSQGRTLAGFVESSAPSYPPYNIERTGENTYRISVAVAGFSQEDLWIEAKVEQADSSRRATAQGENLRNGLSGHCGTGL
jgi:HSP20 family molecular chaperone IbpA